MEVPQKQQELSIPILKEDLSEAEVIPFAEFVKYGSEHSCREAGKLNVEGKEYIVKDGDIMHFRFHV